MMEDGMDMMEDNMDTMEDNMGAVDHEKNVFCKSYKIPNIKHLLEQ